MNIVATKTLYVCTSKQLVNGDIWIGEDYTNETDAPPEAEIQPPIKT